MLTAVEGRRRRQDEKCANERERETREEGEREGEKKRREERKKGRRGSYAGGVREKRTRNRLQDVRGWDACLSFELMTMCGRGKQCSARRLPSSSRASDERPLPLSHGTLAGTCSQGSRDQKDREVRGKSERED